MVLFSLVEKNNYSFVNDVSQIIFYSGMDNTQRSRLIENIGT